MYMYVDVIICSVHMCSQSKLYCWKIFYKYVAGVGTGLVCYEHYTIYTYKLTSNLSLVDTSFWDNQEEEEDDSQTSIFAKSEYKIILK